MIQGFLLLETRSTCYDVGLIFATTAAASPSVDRLLASPDSLFDFPWAYFFSFIRIQFNDIGSDAQHRKPGVVHLQRDMYV